MQAWILGCDQQQRRHLADGESSMSWRFLATTRREGDAAGYYGRRSGLKKHTPIRAGAWLAPTKWLVSFRLNLSFARWSPCPDLSLPSSAVWLSLWGLAAAANDSWLERISSPKHASVSGVFCCCLHESSWYESESSSSSAAPPVGDGAATGLRRSGAQQHLQQQQQR